MLRLTCFTILFLAPCSSTLAQIEIELNFDGETNLPYGWTHQWNVDVDGDCTDQSCDTEEGKWTVAADVLNAPVLPYRPKDAAVLTSEFLFLGQSAEITFTAAIPLCVGNVDENCQADKVQLILFKSVPGQGLVQADYVYEAVPIASELLLEDESPGDGIQNFTVKDDDLGFVETNFMYRLRFRALDGDDVGSLGQLTFDDIRITNAVYRWDFSNNGIVDAEDIDKLSEQIRDGTDAGLRFDLTNDDEPKVDSKDHEKLVTEILGTCFGDADLDHDVDFPNFVTISNNFNAPGGWADGDSNGDGNVDFEDFVLLSNNFGNCLTESVVEVPEPNNEVYLIACLAVTAFRPRRRALTPPICH